MTKVDKLILIVVILALAFLMCGVIGCSYAAYVQQRCIKAGYPEAATTLDLEGYCISWIDATKVVVPLKEIK